MWEVPGARKRSSIRPTLKQRATDGRDPPSPTAILTEALKRNQSEQSVFLQSNPTNDEDAPTKVLNRELFILADYFPDVQVEVLRELLKRFDGESRLPVSIEQLYKYKTEWARGRLQAPPRDGGERIPLDQQFRNFRYVIEATKLLKDEFSSVKSDTLGAVMAEVNNSYSKARPILYNIYHKSTWNLFATTLGFKKKRALEDIPTVLFEKGKLDPQNPCLVSTRSIELNHELNQLFLRPFKKRTSADQEAASLELAQSLNQEEAEQVDALFECQVCFNDLPFENISTCTGEAHVVCLDCVKRTLSEALFGQGWAKSINNSMCTVNCLASSECSGFIPQPLVRRSILSQKSGTETWSKFEARLASDSLTKSAIPTVSCPFCSYAEADIFHTAKSARHLKWRCRVPLLPTIYLILLLETLPAIILILIPFIILFPGTTLTLFYNSLANLQHRQRTSKFVCRNPSCARKSCLKCSKSWHDPHICHEPLILSLRKTVEAARTAAVKRTCPRCGTSFVKSSGCNKLTCVCGYAMCYLCRQNIGKSGRDGAAEGAEGYRHFCEHFRPNGGKCAECDKCDLYKSEKEDEIVRRAGEEAETKWREKEGMVGVKGLEGAGNEGFGNSSFVKRVWHGEIGLQGCVDALVERVVVVEDERKGS